MHEEGADWAELTLAAAAAALTHCRRYDIVEVVRGNLLYGTVRYMKDKACALPAISTTQCILKQQR